MTNGVRLQELNSEGEKLVTNWSIYSSSKKSANVTQALIPVYPKLRISYDDVAQIVDSINELIKDCLGNSFSSKLSWSLFVCYNQDFKKLIRNSELDESVKQKILFKSYPRYIWVAQCIHSHKYSVFYIVFDATDLSTSMFGLDVVSFVPDLTQKFRSFLNINMGYKTMGKHNNQDKFYQFLIDKL